MFEISNHRPLRELWSRILCFAIIRVRIDKLGRFLLKIKCLYSETNYFVKPRNYFPRICLDCLSLHLVFRSKAILNFLEKGLNELLRHLETEFVPSDVSWMLYNALTFYLIFKLIAFILNRVIKSFRKCCFWFSSKINGFFEKIVFIGKVLVLQYSL